MLWQTMNMKWFEFNDCSYSKFEYNLNTRIVELFAITEESTVFMLCDSMKSLFLNKKICGMNESLEK